MSSELKTNKVSPSSGATVTLGDASDVFQLPASAEIDIASGATLDVNGTIDATGATITGFPQGGLQLITSATNNSAVATWDFTDVFTSTYDVYLIVISGLINVNGSSEGTIKIGNSALSSFETFAFSNYEMNANGSVYWRNSAGAEYIDMNNNIPGTDTHYAAQVTVFNPYESNIITNVVGQGASYHTSVGGNSQAHCAFGGQATGTTQSESFQIKASGGNIGSSSYVARVSVYGFAES